MRPVVRDVMRDAPPAVDASDPVESAALLLRGSDRAEVLVFDGNHLVGALSSQDLVDRVVAEHRDAVATSAGSVRSRVPTLPADTSVADGAVMLRTEHSTWVPVVDGDVVVGAVTLDDLEHALEASGVDHPRDE
jgi:CBS domain-containing protein